MKILKKPPPEFHPPVESLPSLALDHKITEMGVILNQLIPSDYDFKEREQRGKTFQELQKLIEYKRQGLLSEMEFASLKKFSSSLSRIEEKSFFRRPTFPSGSRHS